jgi:hypothetical protein
MDIVSMNIAVDQVTCDGCGASTDLKIITATIYGFGGNPGPPDGADMLASQTTLPDGWSTTTVTGPNPSSQALCPDCSGTLQAAVATTLASISQVAVPSPAQPPLQPPVKIQ